MLYCSMTLSTLNSVREINQTRAIQTVRSCGIASRVARILSIQLHVIRGQMNSFVFCWPCAHSACKCTAERRRNYTYSLPAFISLFLLRKILWAAHNAPNLLSQGQPKDNRWTCKICRYNGGDYEECRFLEWYAVCSVLQLLFTANIEE
jgi:hypothetical protein